MPMSRALRSLRKALFSLLLVPATGCTTMSVAWLQPRADGAVEVVLFERRKSPNLHIKSGGALTLDEDLEVSARVRWKAGEPPQPLGKPRETSGPMMGMLPLFPVPAALCGPPGVPAASVAVQREGESIIWCRWNRAGSQPMRIEARFPAAAEPLLSLDLEADELAQDVQPLPGQRAILHTNRRIQMLDAGHRTASLIDDQGALILGVTPEGDVLLLPKGEDPRALQLRLRTGKSLQVPSSADHIVSAAGAVWSYDWAGNRLHRVDPESASRTPVPPLAGAWKLLGKDTSDWLWFESDRSPVRAGRPLPLVRWNPITGASEIVMIPTE